jgi:tetratricopeptide (TPR) repeat protein
MKKQILALALSVFAMDMFAQINLPEPSPEASFTQQVGFSRVTVVYMRPGAKGRKIFGSLVPYNEIWRTGASDASTIKFSESVELEGNKVPAGNYSIFTIPSENEWTIILNKDSAMHGTDEYTPDLDLIRFKVKAEKSARFYENFTFEVTDIVNNNGVLYLIWENTQVRIGIKTSAEDRILAEIKEKLSSQKDNAVTLFQSAKYYYDTGKDLTEALTWLNKAVEIKNDNFYYFYQKSLVEAKLGDYASAIVSGRKAADLAKEKELKGWVKTIESLLADWEKIKK